MPTTTKPADPPRPVTNLTCRRCGGRTHIYVPATGRVRCVDCTTARAVSGMVRAWERKGGRR